MSEPDELYTLRAQFWLGHYQMALDEARSIMRRPMSPDLKAEREEIVARCNIAMKDYDKVISGDTSSKWSKYTVGLWNKTIKGSGICLLTRILIFCFENTTN